MYKKCHGVDGGSGHLSRDDGNTYCLDGSSQAVEVQPLRFLNRNQKNFGNDSMTVDTSNSTGLKQGSKIRRLTPIECERLQGFPDNWTDICSDTQRYKQMGNAVTVNVIQAIGERINEI